MTGEPVKLSPSAEELLLGYIPEPLRRSPGDIEQLRGALALLFGVYPTKCETYLEWRRVALIHENPRRACFFALGTGVPDPLILDLYNKIFR
jgi:hypothetical protein